MSCIEGLVGERDVQSEARLKQALGTFSIGGMIRGYLPQTWVILTEDGAVTVRADVRATSPC